MSRNSRLVVLALVLVAGLTAVYLWRARSTPAVPGSSVAPRKGFVAPGFELATTSGETVSLADYRGQPVLVNLWATWCPPCRAEMQSIEKIYKEYGDQGLVVLSVNMTRLDDVERATAFVAEQGLTYPILLDEDGDVETAYRMRSLPMSFFIDREGIVNQVVIGGPMQEDTLRASVEAILE